MNPPTISTNGPVDGLVFSMPTRIAAGFSAIEVLPNVIKTKETKTRLQERIFPREILMGTITGLELGGGQEWNLVAEANQLHDSNLVTRLGISILYPQFEKRRTRFIALAMKRQDSTIRLSQESYLIVRASCTQELLF